MNEPKRLLRRDPPSENLTPEEYFIWSQVGEGILLKDLLVLCPWNSAEISEKIESLIHKNSARWDIDSAESIYESGLLNEKDKNYVAAHSLFTKAHELDSSCEVYAAAIKRVIPLMKKQKAAQMLDAVKTEANTSGPTPKLMKQLEEALKLDPYLPNTSFIMGRFILELGPAYRMNDAKEMLFRAKAADRVTAEPCYYLARVFEKLGDKKSAKKELKEALRRNPAHLESKRMMERLPK